MAGLALAGGTWFGYPTAARLLHTPHLPAPTGAFHVGRARYHWLDAARPETWTDDPADRRELIVGIWYPAADTAGLSAAPYFAHLDQLRAAFKWSDRRAIRALRTRAFTDAPIARTPGRFPVLLFSPGANLSALFYTSLLEDLASHGFVVVGIEHAYEGRGQVFPDGRIAWPDYVRHLPGRDVSQADEIPFYHAWAGVRARDAAFVLDQLARINEGDRRFEGTLDLTRVGFLGHSIGGIAAVHAARSDTRIRAVADLDGLLLVTDPALVDPTGTGLRQPFLFLGQAAGYEAPQDALLRSATGPQHRVLVAGATHMSFSDWPLWAPGNQAAKRRRIAITRAVVLAFFGKYLRGEPTDLLEHASSTFPEAIVETMRGRGP